MRIHIRYTELFLLTETHISKSDRLMRYHHSDIISMGLLCHHTLILNMICETKSLGVAR